MCNKGLGPTVIVRSSYISEMLRQHLQDKHHTYRLRNDRQAQSRLKAIKIRISKITEKDLPTHKERYFQMSLQRQELTTPQIYDYPKVHKETFPVTLRALVS